MNTDLSTPAIQRITRKHLRDLLDRVRAAHGSEVLVNTGHLRLVLDLLDASDAALASAPPAPVGGAPAGWKLVPDQAIRDWAYDLATRRQGQSSTPRCEPPSRGDVDWAMDRIREVLASAPPAPSTGEEWLPIETAPKDGTKVLLRFAPPFNDSEEDGVVTGSWAGEGWWLSAIWASALAQANPIRWRPLLSPVPGDAGGRS